LARCDAYGALDADDALISARHTGTNVMDLVVAVRV
jgi:glycerate-2-kinase